MRSASLRSLACRRLPKLLPVLLFVCAAIPTVSAQLNEPKPTAQQDTAVIPVPNQEYLVYDWYERHAEALRIKDTINPEIILIGDSILHLWGGEPKLKYTGGTPAIPNGPNAWTSVFGPYRVLNLGFGFDRTQNVLWRLDHGEIDGLQPRFVVIEIGTNNTSETKSARMNTAPEIVEGIAAVCGRIRTKLSKAKVILMAVFPREESPQNPRRLLINEVNRLLEPYAKKQNLVYVDIGPKLLAADGTFRPGMMMLDFTHPTDKGYQVWADAIRPIILGGSRTFTETTAHDPPSVEGDPLSQRPIRDRLCNQPCP
jgi:lysophospholipase L1-like esterase